MMFEEKLKQQATRMLAMARDKKLLIATAESCTGGLIAGLFTDIPGVSDVFERGFVTYSNKSKHEMLGVPEHLIHAHGAVSEAVARAMADGALARASTQMAISVTGIAGPDGGSEQKPVGLVYIALAREGSDTIAREFRFGNPGREQVRAATIAQAINMLEEALG